jgi:dipeptidyl aminopeptidase/acylaminoacyl peptidase
VSFNGVLAYHAGAEPPQRLDWFDRTGEMTRTETVGAIFGFSVSRDGRKLALARTAKDGSRSISIRDLQREAETRPAIVTFGTRSDYQPLFSPDGNRIVFSSNANGNLDLFEKTLSNAEPESKVYSAKNLPSYANDWTHDGRYILFGNGTEIYALAHGQDPVRAVIAPGFKLDPQVSPDDRWLAYASANSITDAQSEVYVQALKLDGKPERRWQVSSAGGAEPRWNPNGRELFFLSPNQKLMSAKIRPGTEFDFDPPAEVFQLPPMSGELLQSAFRYAVAPDGQRFLVLRDDPGAVEPPLTIVTNWRRLLKK